MGWVELGDQSQTGNAVEGTIRYNSTAKCIEFYDGNEWNCVGKPKMQNFTLVDAIDETISGNVTNITNTTAGGYSTQYPFTVDNVQEGDNILFLIELVLHDNLRKNTVFNNNLKISVNGIFERKEVPGINEVETYTTFLWTNDVNTSGNLTFVFEVNLDIADAKITTLVFR